MTASKAIWTRLQLKFLKESSPLLHRIGHDYSVQLKSRKTKRDLPLISRLSRQVDIGPIQEQARRLLRFRDEGGTLEQPEASENNYHLKTAQGETFIRNYDDFYKNYSAICFQELSEEAREHAAKLDFTIGDLSPGQRLKGMKNTGFEKYHPHYDERNYDKPTRYYTESVKELLDGFRAGPCRSALVCLGPGQYISPHFDVGPEYIARVMLPVFTNEKAVIGVRGDGGFQEFHLPADGGLYLINSGYEHYALNAGTEPRYHIRICLNGQDDLDGLSEVKPVRFIADQDFHRHPCGAAR